MDAKYLGVTLSNNLEWSKHIATITNKANSKLSFLRRNLKGCPEKLKQTASFSLVRSFMEYGATVWDPYQKYNSDKIERVQRRAARFVKSRYSRYSSVSDMLDVLGWTPLSQRRQELDERVRRLSNFNLFKSEIKTVLFLRYFNSYHDTCYYNYKLGLLSHRII